MFAALDGDVEGLLVRFSSFRFVYTPTVAAVRERFTLLATGARPHFTVQLPDTSDRVMSQLLGTFGKERHNEFYDRHRGH